MVNVGIVSNIRNVGNTGNVGNVGNTGNVGNVGNTGNVGNVSYLKTSFNFLQNKAWEHYGYCYHYC